MRQGYIGQRINLQTRIKQVFDVYAYKGKNLCFLKSFDSYRAAYKKIDAMGYGLIRFPDGTWSH